jgi:hypothetical protein
MRTYEDDECEYCLCFSCLKDPINCIDTCEECSDELWFIEVCDQWEEVK